MVNIRKFNKIKRNLGDNFYVDFDGCQISCGVGTLAGFGLFDVPENVKEETTAYFTGIVDLAMGQASSGTLKPLIAMSDSINRDPDSCFAFVHNFLIPYKIGEIVISPRVRNPNSGNIIEAYIWKRPTRKEWRPIRQKIIEAL